MTPINNLKQWFRNGLKPTQEQFWAWMDSYWHKNEKIPQTSIDGLDKSLEAKAETTAVDAKANKDATGLDDDNIIAWKEALGVGELPSNIATVDEGEKVGNTHTKEQVVELLGEKLNAPIEEGTTNDYPYVVGVNEENESVKLPAGDLGKNLANSNLTTTGTRTFTQAHIYTHNTAGYHYYITGLANKSADPTFNLLLAQNSDGQTAVSNGKAVLESLMASLPDATGDANAFNIYPVYNAVTNKLAKSVRPQAITNFNVPENIKITQDVNVPGVVINPKPEYSEDLKNALNKIKEIGNLGFIKVKSNELVVKLMEEQHFPDELKGRYSFPSNLIDKPEDGCFIFNGFGNLFLNVHLINTIQHTNYLDSLNAKALYNVFIDKNMPSDKDWVLKVRSHSNGNYYSTGNKGHSIGFRSDITAYADFDFNSTFVKFGGSGAIDTSTLFAKATSIFGISLFTEIYFIKQGSLIITLVLDIQANRYTMEVNTYEETYKKLYFYINPNYYGTQQGQVIFKDISYWIQP